MTNLSENYNLRLHYLQLDQVPTQSMITKHMSPPLAGIFFKSLKPKLRELVGLQPSLKGGGGDWMVDPAELLNGRAVLKPVTRKLLKKLSHKGIEKIGHGLYQKHRMYMEQERAKVLADADANWMDVLRKLFRQIEENLSDNEQSEITRKLVHARDEFEYFYRMSFNKLESLFTEASILAINKSKEEAMELMNNKFMVALKTQATMLYKEYEERFNIEKARLKEEFIRNLEIERSKMGDKIHDVTVDKHACVNLIKQFLHGRNLACQIYVALKEREAGSEERKELEVKHRKQIGKMERKMETLDNEINAARQEEEMFQRSVTAWQKKICHFVKSFQTFVSYSLKTVPEYAEFFINLEKLMLLQVNEVLEDPSAESIIAEEEVFHTPVPPIKPFYLFCDKGYKAQLHEELCPRHGGTSSNASQLPAIIINRQCLYAACDNFEQFTTKIKDYIQGKRGDVAIFRDDLVYENFVPMKPLSDQLTELKLESSLLQILQEANIERLTEKCFCPVDECMCVSPEETAQIQTIAKTKPPPISPVSSVTQKKQLSEDLSKQLEYIHKYKWESYFDYKEPKSCVCAKSIMGQIGNRLPAYMRRAKYPPPDCLPNYEMCSVEKLKELVQNARKGRGKKGNAVEKVESKSSKTKSIGTKCSDIDFQNACTCFSDTLIGSLDPALFKVPTRDSSRVVADSNISTTYMTQPIESFALDRAFSLRNILDDVPDLQDVFKKMKCE